MKIAELRAKSKEELSELVTSLRKERFNLRMQDSTGALESRVRFRETRKTIARAMTVMNETPGAVAKAAKPAKKAAAKKAKKEKE